MLDKTEKQKIIEIVKAAGEKNRATKQPPTTSFNSTHKAKKPN